MYRQLRKSVFDTAYTLVDADADQVGLCLANPKQDFYTSLYKYSPEQYETFQTTKTIKGVEDVISDWLVFDFDSKDNLTLAQDDAFSICQTLKMHGVPDSALRISYSGSKGFHVEVRLTEDITVDEFKNITRKLANGLKTFDKLICDYARPFRVLGSINLKTGLYKIPLTLDQLNNLTINEIKDLAKNQDVFNGIPYMWAVIALPESINALKKDIVALPKPKLEIVKTDEINWTLKPKNFPNCRWAVYNGLFKGGERHVALMTLVSYFKNIGETKETAYHRGLGAIELQAKRNGTGREDEYSKEDFYNTVVKSVFAESWTGGQYTCKEKDSWLHGFCQSLGTHKCGASGGVDGTVDAKGVLDLFKSYAADYEQNVLYSGISNLDKKMKFMVGTSNGILAPPGVGKTSLCLQILEHNSKNDVPCLFYSYDMFHSALYMRMLQRESGKDQDYLYDMFKKDPQKVQGFVENLNDKFRNVQFCFKAGQTIDELEQTIDDTEQKMGRKPKFVIVDYNELVQTDVSDPTSSSATVAQRLRQIANEKGVCVVTLLQPAKQYCSPGDEMTNFNSVKGSSSIVQSLTLLLGCSRPGFNPLDPTTDNYFNITCLKNRNGPLFSLDLSWKGLEGKIANLEDHERMELNSLRDKKKDAANEKKEWN